MSLFKSVKFRLLTAAVFVLLLMKVCYFTEWSGNSSGLRKSQGCEL